MALVRLFVLLPTAPLCPMVLGGSVSPFSAQSGPPAAIAPPVEQATANCASPTYATDRLVCSDMELSALDRTLARLIIDLPPQAKGSEKPWMEGQQAWFKRRSLCAFDKNHIECARSAYITRIAELGAITSDANDDKPLRCPTFTAASRYSISAQGLMVVRDADGEALIAAWPKDQKGWRPFVSYWWESTKGRLTRLGDDATLTCRSR